MFQRLICAKWRDSGFHENTLSEMMPDVQDAATEIINDHCESVNLNMAPNSQLSIALIEILNEDTTLLRRRMSLTTIIFQVKRWIYALERAWFSIFQFQLDSKPALPKVSLLIPAEIMLAAIKKVERTEPSRMLPAPIVMRPFHKSTVSKNDEHAKNKPKVQDKNSKGFQETQLMM